MAQGLDKTNPRRSYERQQRPRHGKQRRQNQEQAIFFIKNRLAFHIRKHPFDERRRT